MNYLSGTFAAGLFAFCTALFWGTYGPLLSKGHHLMLGGGRLRPFICVGIAYFLVAIIGPIVVMYTTGHDKGGGLFTGWTFSGILWSTIAGAVGALGAFALIMALGAGGPSSPVYVMPIVFGCAPVVSALTTMYLNPPEKINPFFAAGLILVAVGAVTTLITAPRPAKKPSPDSHGAKSAKTVVESKLTSTRADDKNPYAASTFPATKATPEDPEQIRAATLAALPKQPDDGDNADVKPLQSQPADESPGDHETA
jgi:hypothetical protein